MTQRDGTLGPTRDRRSGNRQLCGRRDGRDADCRTASRHQGIGPSPFAHAGRPRLTGAEPRDKPLYDRAEEPPAGAAGAGNRHCKTCRGADARAARHARAHCCLVRNDASRRAGAGHSPHSPIETARREAKWRFTRRRRVGDAGLRAALSGSHSLARFQAVTEKTVTSAERLEKTLLDIAKRGYASAPEGIDAGLNALAVPIFDSHDACIATLAIVSPQFLTEKPKRSDIDAHRPASRYRGSLAWSPAEKTVVNMRSYDAQ